jgi:putative ABC transport system permease protein
MHKAIFRMFVRKIRKHNYLDVINHAGLAVGFAGAFILLLYVFNELGYNSAIKASDDVYRVNTESSIYNLKYTVTPYVLGNRIEDDFKDRIALSRVFNLYNSEVRKDDEYIDEDGIYCAENPIFKIMKIRLIAGNPDELLSNPGDAVLSEKAAKKYFGDEMPLGKTLEIENNGDIFYFNIRGVFEDIKENSTFRPEILLPMEVSLDQMDKMITSSSDEPLGKDYYADSWSMFFFYTTYLKLGDGLSRDDLQKKIDSYEGRHFSSDLGLSFNLQNYNDIYFNSSDLVNSSSNGDRKTVLVYAMVALLLLLTSSINYVLLSTAGLVKRRKEISLRIVNGAPNGSIVRQTMAETIIFSYFAAIIGLLLARIALPPVSSLLFGKTLYLSFVTNLPFTFSVLLLPLIIGILSGAYLSMKATDKNALSVITHSEKNKKGSSGIVAILNTVQLIICLSLIICSGIIYSQLHYFRNSNLGFDIKNIISIDFSNNEIRKNYDIFKDELSKLPSVRSVSGSMWSPPTRNNMAINMSKIGNPEEKITLQGLMVDYDIVKTLGLGLSQGSDFDSSEPGSENKIIINEKAVKSLEIDGSPVGLETKMGTIVGVVEDFHIQSFHKEVPPTLLQLVPMGVRTMLVRSEPGNIDLVYSQISTTWETMFDSQVPEYKMLTDALEELYSGEKRFAGILTLFCALTLFVALLGIFAMAVLNTRKRTKEVGIRKALGAEYRGLLGKYLVKYIIMIILSASIAFPLSYSLMIRWLQDFEYHSRISPFVFILSLLTILLVVLSTVTIQITKLANTNPVNSLRYE